jgi:predicted DNA-binding protein
MAKEDRKYRNFNARITQDEYEQLQAWSVSAGKTMSKIVTEIVQEVLRLRRIGVGKH